MDRFTNDKKTDARKPKRAIHIDRQVAANIRRFRKEAGWTQVQLAAAIGVSFQQFQKYEKGTNRISVGRLILICEALAVPLTAMTQVERA